MHHSIKGAPSFSHIELTLDPGEEILSESRAMASMDSDIAHSAKINGNVFGALVRKIFGRESFFLNHFRNDSASPKTIILTQNAPGDIKAVNLKGGGFYIQQGAYIASGVNVRLNVKWAGFRSLFAGEGLLRSYVHGTGPVYFGGYGAIYEKEIDGEYIVDTTHIIGYSSGVKLHVGLSGGIFSSIFSGEGLVTRVRGRGKIYLQSRSVQRLAGFLNPKFPV